MIDEKQTKGIIDEYDSKYDPEPRWHALIAVVAVGGLYTALPAYLRIAPSWLFVGIIIITLIPIVISHRKGYHLINQTLGFLVTGIVTVGMIASVILLINALPEHRESPTDLLISASSLWITNILVFALWYWRLDAGGPHQRDKTAVHVDGAFLFPQMTMHTEAKEAADEIEWVPNFIDYLFLSFNTSTAFSPTDAPVLARWAKLLMMLQSLISLMIIVLLAARGVNIL